MTKQILKAQKFTSNDKFLSTCKTGYLLFTGDWGIINTESNEWVTFDNELPYRPVGGRKVSLDVAKTCNPDDLNYISTI